MSGSPETRRRLRELAGAALRRYPFAVRGCSLLPESFNAVFGIDAADASRYALRLSAAERIHPDGVEAAELAWMEALARDGIVPVPAVTRTADGSPWIQVAPPGSGDRRIAVLFGWVPGRPMSERPSVEGVRRAGELSALLHEDAAGEDARPAAVPVADRVVYWRLEARFAELRPTHGTLFDEAADAAGEAIERLWRHPPHRPHLLHGDFIPQNLIIEGDRVCVIDFQDCFWGFEAQDIAISVTALRRLDDGERCEREFRSGYERRRPWPIPDTATLDALVAARRLHLAIVALNLRREGFGASVARQAGPLAEWLRGIRRPVPG
ncbi:MAG TPA: phosphotransferase [Candidatus Limnocylindria bacterium]|nr:phosphotransferase [Candidatus Limnocylindria bacterium]